MWQPAQSRCLDFAEPDQAIKAFSHTLGRKLPVLWQWLTALS
jgi:hypothetical protein